MGHINQFEYARRLIAKELHFSISGEASDFQNALDRAGTKRLEHCVKLVSMWARPHNTGQDKYAKLMQLLRLVTPGKTPGTKYRNPAAGAGKLANDLMDRELASVLARNP